MVSKAVLPPGMPWLANVLVALCKPSATVLLVDILLRRFADFEAPRAIVYGLAAVSLPATLSFRIWLEGMRDRRAARKLGARMIPRVKGRWPGNFDVVLELLASLQHGYLADRHLAGEEECGHLFNFRLVWNNVFATSEPEHMKILLATEFENNIKGDIFQSATDTILGTGVFNADGELWKFHRSMARPFFSRERVTHFDLFGRHADTSITFMKQRLREGYPVDFQDVAMRFTVDSASEFLFGAALNSLSAPLPYPHFAPEASTTVASTHPGDVFAAAFAEVMIIARERLVNTTWPMAEITHDRSERPMRIVNALIEPILDEALKRRQCEADDEALGVREKKAPGVVEEGDTLLDYLVRQTTDKAILRDSIVNMLVAGRDTTAALLTFTMYALAMYPEVLAKLQAEISAQVGPTRAPTYTDIREMKYLRATLNETLRLYPPIPINMRKTVQPSTWPAPLDDPDRRPFYVPGNSEMAFVAVIMHRRKDLWGNDADEFDPERFLDARLHKYLIPNPFIFLPFSAGPRICLGQQFAYNEVSFMIIRLLQAFSSVALAPSAQPPGSLPPADWAQREGRPAVERCFPKSNLTLYMHGGMWVSMEEAEPSA